MTSNVDSWARMSFEPGARVVIAPYRDKRCFDAWAAYDGEAGTVKMRLPDGKVKVALDRRLAKRSNEPVVPMMALRPVEEEA